MMFRWVRYEPLFEDETGVPKMVQCIKYRRADMTFELKLFNGQWVRVCSEWLLPSLSIMATKLTRRQWQEALNAADKWAEKRFLDWKVPEQIVPTQGLTTALN